ncbi:MAG: YceI family protein, partial [Burkholderiaceae bacterium]
GNLTLKGLTNPATRTVVAFQCLPHPMLKKDACGATATTKVKRTALNMGKYAPYVGDEVTITLPIEAIKQ